MTTRRDFIRCGTLIAAATLPSASGAVIPGLRPVLAPILPERVYFDLALGPDNGFARAFRAQGISAAAVAPDPSGFWRMIARERQPIAGLTRSSIPFCFSQQAGVGALRLRAAARIPLAAGDHAPGGWAKSRQMFVLSAQAADQILRGESMSGHHSNLSRVMFECGCNAADSLVVWFAAPAAYEA